MAEENLVQSLGAKKFWTGVGQIALGVSFGIVVGIPAVNALSGMFKSALPSNTASNTMTNTGTSTGS